MRPSVRPTDTNRTNIFHGKRSSYVQHNTNYPKNLIKFASETKTVHPTQKPIDLMDFLIKTYTRGGELVLDFTMGSGSTGVSCMLTDRQFIGIENTPQYYKIAYKRIKEARKLKTKAGG